MVLERSWCAVTVAFAVRTPLLELARSEQPVHRAICVGAEVSGPAQLLPHRSQAW